jgi:cytochrome c553
MRWFYFALAQCLLIGLVGAIVYIHKDRVVLIKTPPASLAQWYKPENKRQLWLHNMFKLRREMQAVKFYADNREDGHLQKWAGQLSEHYLAIGEMVPEWKKKLDLDLLAELEGYVKNSSYREITHTLDKLGETCDSCHTDFRAITATIYRSANFSSMGTPGQSTSLKEHMKTLTQQVNLIKIASEDGMQEIALSALSDLEKGMNTLGETCATCHKKDERKYPGDDISETASRLEESLVGTGLRPLPWHSPDRLRLQEPVYRQSGLARTDKALIAKAGQMSSCIRGGKLSHLRNSLRGEGGD